MHSASTVVVRLLTGLATLGCLGALGWVASELRTPRVEVPTVGGAPPPTNPDAWTNWLSSMAPRFERRDVLLEGGDQFLAVTLGDLGFTLDRPALEDSLTRNSHTLTTTERGRRAWSEWAGVSLPPGDLPLVWRFDAERAQRTLNALASDVASAPRNAALDFARRELVADAPGRQLDVLATLSELRQFSPNTRDSLALHFAEVPPVVRVEDLAPVDPRRLLASFDTDFSKKRGPRIHNIRRAARYLDGTILAPSATLSFNEVVGKRVAERGFVDAPVIVNDVMESGMGGGVCQVATTLHAAAVYGGLEITERRSHSRPSGYAPLGLDATVLDGVQDLKIKNPYSVPLYVRAYLPSRYVIRIELFGAELNGKVKHSNWVVERHAFTRRVVEKAELPTGTFKVSQKGGFGYDTVSTVVLTPSHGERQERRYKSTYYPVPEVLWIGPGTRPTDLPPLPDAAGPGSGAEQTL